ncbi:MAG TPA: RluA family pseudouridine synthase [Solirubrobacteraceae bacterium]
MRVAVTDEQAGERLDVVLGEALGSRARAQRLIDAGRVTVDGAVRPKRHRVHAHEVIEAADDEASRTAPVAEEAVPFVVVYEDEALLVVDKPAGVVVHPAPGHATGTLAQALGLTGRAGIVHRLDRDTSGLLVVAKTDAAHQALQRAIQRREVTREYLALVEGRPPARSGTVDAPIGRDRRARTRHSIETDTPRAAVTHFTVERLLPEHTLLRVRLETGRTHQIRVHLQAIGHPVAGDPEYGGRAGELGLRRQFLHAARLAFAHPRTGERVDLRSPLPADLCAALSRAGG